MSASVKGVDAAGPRVVISSTGTYSTARRPREMARNRQLPSGRHGCPARVTVCRRQGRQDSHRGTP
eukprot:5342733-Heterocapsa_arctica.AAC.1